MSLPSDARLKELTDDVFRAKGLAASSEEVLRTRGISMSPRQLFELMLDQVSQMPEIHRQPSAGIPSKPTHNRLADAGLTFEPFEGDEDPVATSMARFTDLIASSLSTQEAAERLGVGGSRVRQLLTAKPPQIYGFKESRGAWRIPRFQFAKNRLATGIPALLAALPPDLHPLEVETWFQAPNPDLRYDGDRPLSPLQWLKLGLDIETVVAIAKRLD